MRRESTCPGDPSGETALARIIGESPTVRELRAHIRRIARSPVPVLILGETGTGKELCAEAIFRLSGQSHLVAVNCAAFPENLIDSELFGHVRGAFTGADRNRSGLVAQADGGLLFLDELAEISPAVQAKLLRTLESGEYRPVGATESRTATFRILAATSCDLERVILAGRLRADLLHRLGAMRIFLPPLRDRMEDLPLLVEEFLRRYRERAGHAPRGIATDALTILADHPWPGNLRELRNVVEAAAALAGEEKEIRVKEIIQVLSPSQSGAPILEKTPTLTEVLHRAERRALWEALRVAGGNRARAAALMGISEATLYRKLAAHERDGDSA